MKDHMTRIQFELTRVADALERIAIIMAGDQVENIITVSPGPFVWSEAVQTFVEAEEPTEHCGRCYEFPGCDMDLRTCHAHPPGKETAQATWDWLGITQRPGRRPGRPSHCGRCGREGTRRMNHANHCRECRHEAWWDE